MTQDKTENQTISHCMDIYNEWVREDLIEDRLEYTDEDLKLAYPQLGDLNIQYLRDLLDDVRNDKPIIDLDYDAELIKEMIGEACHQGLDGWSVEESACIEAFLRDIGIACANAN